MNTMKTLKAAVMMTLATLAISGQASATENNVEQYIDALVKEQVMLTTYEINNEAIQTVARASYAFELDHSESAEWVATVTTTMLDSDDVVYANGAE